MDGVSILNKVVDGSRETSFTSKLEGFGSSIGTLGRVLFGRTYYKLDSGELAQPEYPLTLGGLALKTAAIVFLPFTLISALFGLVTKAIALKMNPKLKNKYHGEKIINYRDIKQMEKGLFPVNPWTPNCVNSQQKSLYGKLYNADPISVPTGVRNPLVSCKEIIKNLYPDTAKIVQEHGFYQRYEFTVDIPKLGVFTDDVDIYLNPESNKLDIRSASRKGIRDALNIDFHQPGANKKRIEAIREAFSKMPVG